MTREPTEVKAVPEATYAAADAAGGDRGETQRGSTSDDQPARRPLRVYTFDPMRAATLERIGPATVTVDVAWEPLLAGPSGARVQIIDFDGGRAGNVAGARPGDASAFYMPVDLDDPVIAVQGGLAPSESDPRFHQQMVYAVAMRTFEAFDRATGRRIRAHRGRLRLFPHGVRDDNAYYDPDLAAVVFGYFDADTANPGLNLAGQTVFTCLSHDIIAHEVTHALIHRMRPWLLAKTNPDVGAFHEAVADVTAIFLHFKLPGVVEATVASTGTQLTSATPLAQLAEQFGHATGKGGALRSAIDVPDPRRYQTERVPHARGAILVAAVFDAFHTVYQSRIADLLRLATGGTGVLPAGALHPDLVARVAREAVHTADMVLTVCLRAFDYLPPVDVTFSDFLRAIVTSDRELFPTDGGGLRLAFIDAFRRRGIYPRNVVSFSEASLVWPSTDVPVELPGELRAQILALDALSLDPTAVDVPDPSRSPSKARRSLGAVRGELEKAVAAALAPHAAALELSPGAAFKVIAVQALFRYDEDGASRVNFVVQCTQEVRGDDAPAVAPHLLRVGIRRATTVIFDESGRVRHLVAKPLPAADLEPAAARGAEERRTELTGWLSELTHRDAGAPFGFDAGGSGHWRIDFASLHRGRP